MLSHLIDFGEIVDELAGVIVEVFQILGQIEILRVDILRVEFIDPAAHIDSLRQQKHQVLMMLGLVAIVDYRQCIHLPLHHLYDQNYHMCDLFMHNIQGFHCHIRIRLVTLKVNHGLHFLLVNLLHQYFLEVSFPTTLRSDTRPQVRNAIATAAASA